MWDVMKYRTNSFDPELRTQLKGCEPYFRGNDFRKFLQAQRRFESPAVYVAKEGQRGLDSLNNEPVYYYHLRATLSEIPVYMRAVNQVGLSYKRGFDILMHLFNGDKYNFSQKESDLAILAKALTTAKEDQSLPKSIKKIKKLMSAGVGGCGMRGTLYGFYITSRLGVPIAEAGSIIAKGAEGSYVMGPFNEALKSMLPAKPNPKLVVEAFRILDGDGRNYWNSGGYKHFEELMTFAAPGMGISVDNMLAMFVSAAKSKSKRKELECAVGKKETAENKERYFLQYAGELEHFAQPYVTRRSLNEGLKDLESLAHARYNDWREVGEGMFVFDPKSQLWYSLGGKLELPSMEEVLSGRAERVRHNFLPYDISSLSDTPFLFHVHPKELDTFVTPERDSLVCPHLQKHITKFLTATPSRADYKVVAKLMKDAKIEVKPRAFISHALGITEFVFPYDIKAIEEMGIKARDLRDQPLLNFRPHLIYLNEAQFVEALVQDLNAQLPEGFAIKLNQPIISNPV
jgi:hypothetical protein